MCIRFIIGSLIALVAVAPSLGETPLSSAFTYQGQLKQGGAPFDGTIDFQFTLWDAAGSGNPPTGGVQVGGVQSVNALPVSAGLFNVALNPGGEFGGSAFNGNARWVQIAVRSPAGGGVFTTLAPRQALTATPHSLFALNADRLDGLDSSAFLQTISGIPAGGDLSGAYPNPTVARIQTRPLSSTAPTSGQVLKWDGSAWSPAADAGLTLPFSGTANADIGPVFKITNTATSGPNYGVYSQSASTSGYGVLGYAAAATGATYGVYGQSASTSGIGVFGHASAGTGSTYGVYGRSDSTTGLGVCGRVGTGSNWTNFNAPAGVWGDTADGNGVLGTGTNGTGVAGVSTFGRGVFAFSQSGDALEAVASGQNRTAVWGRHDGATGAANGVLGQSASTDGRGVSGQATAATGTTYGVYGENLSTDGQGVKGWARAPSGSTYGVIGVTQSVSGYGVYSVGELGGSGAKSFRIDHPDDPANKYLLHYAAESPEVINFYRGTVVLDGAGEAVVDLPHYFAKINKTPSYQLTAVGAPMPMLHVAEKINEAALSAGATAGAGVAAPACTFRISGGAPGGEVSWRVEAVRNDLWVQTRAMPVEVEKQGLEKGTYQHPELYGLSAEMGMNYVAPAERGLHDYPDTERPVSRTLPDATPP